MPFHQKVGQNSSARVLEWQPPPLHDKWKWRQEEGFTPPPSYRGCVRESS